MTSVNIQFLTYTAHQKPTVGDTKISVVGLDHMGWFLCDGRLLNVKDHLLLFNVLGYQFGGAGGQFALPAPAGRVTGIAGSGTGLTSRAIGSNVGAETHTLTVAEMPTHTHTINDPTHTHTYNTASDTNTGYAAVTEDDNVFKDITTANTSSSSTGITINNTGGSNAHNNMQPTLFVGNMFIYSGKANSGNYPFTAGYYNVPAVNNNISFNIE
jgi:microcystin-dependent protein